MPFEAQANADQITPPLRIGLFTPAWPGQKSANGIATAVAHLSAGLQAIGHEVTIIAHWIDGPINHPRVIGLSDAKMSFLDRLLFRIRPSWVLRKSIVNGLLLAAKDAVEKHKIEVILIEETHGWAGDLRRKLSIPMIITLHGPWWVHRAKPDRPDGKAGQRREAQEASCLGKADGIIAPSLDVLDRTRREWGIPNVPCAVIGNPVAFASGTGLAADGPESKILFVGRFDRVKGGDLMIEAFRKVAAAHPACKFTVVGPDPGVRQDDGTLHTLAEQLAVMPTSLRERITVLGTRTREEIEVLRASHPITVISSRYETFGVALIEAMASGAAVVCTRVGGCSEIVKDGETGLLVAPEDPDAIAAGCLRLLGDPALTRRLGLAARIDVRSRFAPEVIARQVASFVAPICRRQRSNPDLAQTVSDPAVDHRG